MPYCSQQDMVDRFGEQTLIELTDRTGSGAVDTDVLQRAIDDAGAEIDAYVGARYELPLSTVPRSLVRVACDLAYYNLFDLGAPEETAKRRESDIRFLRAVADGKLTLGLSESGSQAKPADGAEMHSGGRVFDRDKGGFL